MKVVKTKLPKRTAREITSRGSSTTIKRLRDADGKLTSFHVIDLSSRTIDQDLTYVFGRNVARARAENKKVIGTADGQPAKR